MAKTCSTSEVHRTTPPLRLDEAERVHVGVDVHKTTYSVAVYSGDRGLLATWAQPADPEVLLARLGPIRGQVAEVVYEAGPTGFSLARRLKAQGLAVLVIAPSQVLTPAGQEAKSDRVDCRRLAWMSQKGLLRPVHIPTEQQAADR